MSRAVHVALEGLGHGEALRCPSCTGDLESEEVRQARDHEVLACRACAGLWLDEATCTALRARPAAAPGASARDRPREGDLPRDEDRPIASEPSRLGAAGRPEAPRHAESPVFAPGPAKELAALAAMFGLAWLFVGTRLGEALAYLCRIQFHELGHALVAWSTGRRAVPLPLGWTTWSLERSYVLVAMQLVFCALLAILGIREKKALALGAATALATLLAWGLSTPLEASEVWVVAGGTVGEALLPALALLAFHAPLPERLRWDFWRWPLALLAVVALASVSRDDLAIGAGLRPIPFGTFLTGRQGDGDLERLVNDYGWAHASLGPLFLALGAWSLVLGVLPHPIALAARAWRARERPA